MKNQKVKRMTGIAILTAVTISAITGDEGILSQTKNLAGEIFLNMDLNTEDAYFREQT